MSGTTEDVARQYAAYQYPRPIDDLGVAIAAGGVDSSDPFHFHLRYWPDRPYRGDIKILVAGCGTNQAAHLAFTNRGADVLGIDLSEASLANQARLKARHGLSNLRLMQLDLMRSGELGETFDLVVSTGVLHHLPDPVAGLKALAGALAIEGAIHVMLYGRYARIGVYMMQEMFRRMRVGQSVAEVAFARDVLGALPPEHYLNWHRRRSGDLEHDAGLVDTLLHPVDRAYTSDEVIDFAAQAGLVFQGWGDNRLYYPDARIPAGHPIAARLAALPERDRWACVELFVQDTMLHSAVYCRPDRDPRSYRVNFESLEALSYVPVWNVGVKNMETLGGTVPPFLTRGDDSLAVTPDLARLLAGIDGVRTIAECAQSWEFAGPQDQKEALAIGLIGTLWRQSFVQARIPRSAK